MHKAKKLPLPGQVCQPAHQPQPGSPRYGAPDTSSCERRKIDEQDAMRIERGMWQLDEKHRGALKHHYVRARQRYDICRIVGVKVSRRGFATEPLLAQIPIEKVLGSCTAQQ